MAWFALYLLATLLVTKLRMRRPALVLLAPWLVLDCLGNMACGNSGRNTMSAEAWRQRLSLKYWWCHGFVDFFFGHGHCEQQAAREDRWGGVWPAWWRDIRGLPL